MDKKNIVITGGSGFVGSELTKKFLAQGFSVTILDLVPPKNISDGVNFIKVNLLTEPVPEAMASASAVVHLMGASIFNRWTTEYKKLIYDTRVVTAKKIIDFFRTRPVVPEVFVSASAVGFYGSRGDELLDESAKAGDDFLAKVCVDWEGAVAEGKALGIRTVSVRTGIVLAPGGGMLGKLIPIFKWGLGGRMGSGKQWFSFIAMPDLLNVYDLAVRDTRLSGPVNAVAPVPVQNSELARTLGEVLHRPAILPMPAFLLKIVLGEFADAVLSSVRVVPGKLAEINFEYKARTLKEALS